MRKPHGTRGEVSVEVRTDDPDLRFGVGCQLRTDPADAGPLTVAAVRWHGDRLLVTFTGISDMSAAARLRGVWLTVDAATVGEPDDPDEFHDHQLTGLAVVTTAGDAVGVVTDVLHHGQDLLVVAPPAGNARREVLIPFVAAIVVEVDVPRGRLVVDPPPGLLDLAGERGAD